MTNEQLAELIGQGGNDELIPLLWEKVRRLVYMQCDRIYRRAPERFISHGIEAWDLKQEAYTAFLAAVKAYDADKGYKFTTYLPLHIKGAVRRVLAGGKDPLNNCDSLDKPIETQDGEFYLSDIIPDEDACEPYEDVDRRDVYRELHAVVDELPEQESEIIKACYFSGKTITAIAQESGLSVERIRQVKNKALRHLRLPKNVHRLAEVNPYRHKTLSAFRVTFSSEVEDYAERRELILKSIAKRADTPLPERLPPNSCPTSDRHICE